MGVYTQNEYQEIIDNRKRFRTTSTYTANETLRPSIAKEVAKFHVGHLYIATPTENSKTRGQYSAQRILPFKLYKTLAKYTFYDRIFIPIPKLKPKAKMVNPWQISFGISTVKATKQKSSLKSPGFPPPESTKSFKANMAAARQIELFPTTTSGNTSLKKGI